MVEKVYPMTLEGKEKLEKELEELKTVKRGEIIERIKIARGFGDLSENSEYESAKDEQAFVEGRITTIENYQMEKKKSTRLSEALKQIRFLAKFPMILLLRKH